MAELLGYQFDRTYAGAIERYRKVATIAERDAIPTGKRWEGMLCYVTSETTDYQLRGGLTNGSWAEVATGGGDFFDTTLDDSDDITEGIVNLFMDSTEQAKLGFITVTQAVDLDQMEIDIAALGSGVTFKGSWSPSGGSFPGGGTTAIGDLYIADDGGTIDSVTFASGDGIIATVVNASTSVYAANWAKTESVSDVTSVVGLTGVISKSALLAALNVEDGATADMTGAEISSAITTYLTTSAWQTQRTQEEIEDFVGAMIGTQTNITVTYDDGTGLISFVVTPSIVVYADLATLIAGQGSQVDNITYEVTDASGFTDVTSGRAWVRWKGTTAGTEADYIIISKAESSGFTSPLTTKGDLLTYSTLDARLGVGADGLVLTADSSEPTGLIWSAVAGSGDVVGPASAVDENIAVFDSTTGKLIKDSTVNISKLNGIEAGADVTDATNVDAAGATMNTDTTLAGNSYFLDEDNMVSDSATKVPSQQSVKAYVDTEIATIPVELGFACSDETTDLVAATSVLTFRMPYAMTLTEVRATVGTAPTGSAITVDINETATTILSTKLTIDATEKTSETAAVPPVISDSALADDAEITIDIDGVGSTIAGAGLKIWLIGTRT